MQSIPEAVQEVDMDAGTVLVALLALGVIGSVAIVAIIHGSFELKADKQGIDVVAANKGKREKRNTVRKSK